MSTPDVLKSEVCRLAQFKEDCPEQWLDKYGPVNLLAPFAETLNRAVWYDSYMFHRRLAGAAAREVDVSKVILDGCLKLNGRVCGRPVAELIESPELKLFTAAPCSCDPLYGKRRCAAHDLSGGHVGDAQASEAIVAHRRRRVLVKEGTGAAYDVLLKPVDYVLARNESAVAGRWVSASKVTTGQLNDYWAGQEPSGYVSLRTPAASFDGLSCKTSKESCKEYKRLIRQGRLGGVLVAVTSCGYILHISPFTGAETVPLRFFFIAALKHLDFLDHFFFAAASGKLMLVSSG